MAVSADPGNWELRLHFAEVLLEAGEGQRALEECGVVLGSRPDDGRALRIAGQAATLTGNEALAARYERLAAAVGESSTEADATFLQVPAKEKLAAGEAISEERAIDAFIDEVLGGDPDVEHPDVRLADVGGLEDVKKRLETSFLGPMRNPDSAECMASRCAADYCSMDHLVAERRSWPGRLRAN